MKNVVFWDVTPCGSCNNRRFLSQFVFLRSESRLLVTANVVPSSPILVTLMKKAQVPPKRRFLQEPHGVTSQKTPFFFISLQFRLHATALQCRDRPSVCNPGQRKLISLYASLCCPVA
jgi:hypothetical protein